jgi:hypothetical protein
MDDICYVLSHGRDRQVPFKNRFFSKRPHISSSLRSQIRHGYSLRIYFWNVTAVQRREGGTLYTR